MSKKIIGSEYALSKLFSSDFDFVVPSYQRPFSWTVEQASELFSDLFNFFQSDPNDTYFLGSVVFIKEESSSNSQIVDGQQRITTLTILFASIASMLNDDDKKQFLNYIYESGNIFQNIPSKPRLKLRERDQSFFKNYVQELKLKELLDLDPAQLENDSQRNIYNICKLFVSSINEYLSDYKMMFGFASFLVSSCYLVVVSTPNEDSAFRVFSVLNNRGLDLQPTDIIKADIIGRLDKKVQDEYTKKWEDLEDQLGRFSFNELFGHIRMINLKSKPKNPIVKDFKILVTEKHPPENVINKIIEPYALAFITIIDESYESSTKAEEINYMLKWLNKIENSDWIPIAIILLSDPKYSSEQIYMFLKKLERLAAYLQICEKDFTKRSKRYSEILMMFERDSHFSEIEIKLNLSKEEKNEMIRHIEGPIYTKTNKRRNHLIQRLDSFLTDGGATYENKLFTVEHVLPQKVSGNSEWLVKWPLEDDRNFWVHRLANLVPLTRQRNSSAQNFPFIEKKEKYFMGNKNVSSYALTSQVLRIDDWTLEAVEKRQKELVNILIEGWDLN